MLKSDLGECLVDGLYPTASNDDKNKDGSTSLPYPSATSSQEITRNDFEARSCVGLETTSVVHSLLGLDGISIAAASMVHFCTVIDQGNTHGNL